MISSMKLRPSVAWTLFVLMLSGLSSASVAAEAVTVFAAASVTNALTELGQSFEQKENVRVLCSFASSSTLAKQIENGAPANVFISADLEWMDYLEKLKLIVPPSRLDLLANRLVLITPADSSMSVTPKAGFDLAALLEGGLLAAGDPDHVPAGKYAKSALQKLGVWDSVSNKIARADSVRAALALVERGETPLGIVYATDAAISLKVRVAGIFPEDLHPPITYPAALIEGKATPAAMRFLDFLKNQDARAVFEKYGFTVR
jgi:molybdate transport system substrate-binding protein